MSLLRWDSESLSSLLALHRGMAAALLRSERTAAAPPPPVSSREPNIDGRGNQPQQRHHCSDKTALKRAAESLTIALAIVGAGDVARPSTSGASPPGPALCGADSRRGGNISNPVPGDEVTAGNFSFPRKHGRTPAAKDIATAARTGGGRLQNALPSSDSKAPRTVSNDNAPSPSNEAPISSSKRGLRPRVPRQSTAAAAAGVVTDNTVVAATFIYTSSPDEIAELYAMRCTAREKLGYTRGAFEDAREGVRLAPRAAKLWAKAASLALRTEGDGEDAEGRRLGGCDGIEEGATTTARLTGAMEVSEHSVGKQTPMGRGGVGGSCLVLLDLDFFHERMGTDLYSVSQPRASVVEFITCIIFER